MAKARLAPYGVTHHRAALARGKQTRTAPTAVLQARYDPEAMQLILELRNGARVALPVSDIVELRGRRADDLAQVEVSPGQDGLLWRALDVGISTPGLLADFFGSAVHAQLGSAGGRRSTLVKARTARANGTKGGRPRKAAAKT